MKTPTRLVVGCPVRLRTWCLPAWRDALVAALDEAAPRFGPFQVELVFVAGADDSDTLELLNQWGSTVLTVNEPFHLDIRDWDYNGDDKNGRLHHMVDLRNLLLSHVREMSPDFFLSLDSDMLLDRDALYGMLDCYETHRPFGCWAVGGKAYMSDYSSPSYANWSDPYDHNRGITRVDYQDMMPVSIIMGIKLIDPRAYQVDYEYSRHGEDIGWSDAVATAGGKLWWDGRYCSTHLYRGELTS